MQRKRDREGDKGTRAQCGDQNSLGDRIEYQKENEDNEAGKRALQQVALQVGFSKLAVEVQKTAPSGEGAQFTLRKQLSVAGQYPVDVCKSLVELCLGEPKKGLFANFHAEPRICQDISEGFDGAFIGQLRQSEYGFLTHIRVIRALDAGSPCLVSN